MSHLLPDSNDSIKEKCSKACFLFLTGHIDEVCLLTWLLEYKAEFDEKDFKLSQNIKRFISK